VATPPPVLRPRAVILPDRTRHLGPRTPSEPTGSPTRATAPEPVGVVTGEAQCPENQDRPDRAQQLVREVAPGEDPDHHTDDRALPSACQKAVEEPRPRWLTARR